MAYKDQWITVEDRTKSAVEVGNLTNQDQRLG